MIHLYSIWGLDVSAYYAPKAETSLGILTNLQDFATKLERASRVIQVNNRGIYTWCLREASPFLLFLYDLILSALLD